MKYTKWEYKMHVFSSETPTQYEVIDICKEYNERNWELVSSIMTRGFYASLIFKKQIQ